MYLAYSYSRLAAPLEAPLNLLNGLGKNYTICPVLRAEKVRIKMADSLRKAGPQIHPPN